MINEAIDALKYLRGFFNSENLFLGGSFARNIALNIDTSPNDIDIFILEPRRFESWALENVILPAYFDDVYSFTNDCADFYYKIENQYKYIICHKNNVKFDLIFCNITEYDLITKSTYSELSVFLYYLLYNNKLKLYDIDDVKNAFINIIVRKKVHILNSESTTEKHRQKINKYCEDNNLELVL